MNARFSHQLLIMALFGAAMSFLTLAASFAEVPRSEYRATVWSTR
jgi:hypothetical protein